MFSIQGCSFPSGLSPGRGSSEQAENKMVLGKWFDFTLAISSPCAEQGFVSEDCLEKAQLPAGGHSISNPKKHCGSSSSLGFSSQPLVEVTPFPSNPSKLQVLDTFHLPIPAFPCKQGIKSKNRTRVVLSLASSCTALGKRHRVGDGQRWGCILPGWLPAALHCRRCFRGKVTPPGRCDTEAGARQEEQSSFCCTSHALLSFLKLCQCDAGCAIMRLREAG